MNAPLSIDTCEAVAENAEAYLEGTLADAESTQIESHLTGCAACRERIQSYREVHNLMEYSQIDDSTAATMQAVVVPARSFWSDKLGAAPWWFVSVALHTLIIALAGLISMAIEMPRS